MPNIKISEKGRALLRRRFFSAMVVNAIVRDENTLSTKDGLLITVNGKELRVKAASLGAHPKSK